MGDQIKIQHGADPWRPTDDAEIIDSFLQYDFPRIGILRQGGNEYLFACIDEFRSLGLWAYTLIDRGDEARLREISQVVVEHFESTSRPITLVLADERGIIHAADFVDVEGEPFLRSALDSISNSLDELTAHRELFAAAG